MTAPPAARRQRALPGLVAARRVETSSLFRPAGTVLGAQEIVATVNLYGVNTSWAQITFHHSWGPGSRAQVWNYSAVTLGAANLTADLAPAAPLRDELLRRPIVRSVVRSPTFLVTIVLTA